MSTRTDLLDVQSGFAPVEGTDLFYEVCGSGPTPSSRHTPYLHA